MIITVNSNKSIVCPKINLSMESESIESIFKLKFRCLRHSSVNIYALPIEAHFACVPITTLPTTIYPSKVARLIQVDSQFGISECIQQRSSQCFHSTKYVGYYKFNGRQLKLLDLIWFKRISIEVCVHFSSYLKTLDCFIRTSKINYFKTINADVR